MISKFDTDSAVGWFLGELWQQLVTSSYIGNTHGSITAILLNLSQDQSPAAVSMERRMRHRMCKMSDTRKNDE